MIPVQRQTTVRTIVPANRQVFLDLLAAAAALLACAFGIDFHNRNTSFCSFVLEDAHERAPGGIRDRPGQPAVPQHPLDVEAFDSDQAICEDQTTGDLVMMLVANILDAGMNRLQTTGGFPSLAAALPFASDSAASATKRGQFLLKITRIGFALTVAGGKERFQAHVDADRWFPVIGKGNVGQFAGENDEPLVRFTLERGGLDRAFCGAMQLDADRADVVDAETVVVQQFDAVAVAAKGKAIETVPSLETRVAGLGTFLDSAKKVGKGAIQSPQGFLSRGGVEPSEERVAGTLLGKPATLPDEGERSLLRLINGLPLLQRLIIQTAVRFEGDGQLALLVRSGPQSVTKGASHNGILRCSASFFQVGGWEGARQAGQCGNT